MKIEFSHDGYQHLATTSNYDGPGSPIGTGATQNEARADLMEQLADKADETAHGPFSWAADEDVEPLRAEIEAMSERYR